MPEMHLRHDIFYGDFQDLTRRRASDKIWWISKMSCFVVCEFFDKKNAGGTAKNKNMSNKESAEELHKPITRKFGQRKVYSSFTDNIWGVDLVDMQLINKFNKGIRFLLYVIDIFSKYAWVIPLKDKKGITNTNSFQKIINKSNHKPNKI